MVNQEATDQATVTKIAELNDEFRRRGIGGSRYVTAGIQAEGPEFLIRATAEVAAFNLFDSGVESRWCALPHC